MKGLTLLYTFDNGGVLHKDDFFMYYSCPTHGIVIVENMRFDFRSRKVSIGHSKGVRQLHRFPDVDKPSMKIVQEIYLHHEKMKKLPKSYVKLILVMLGIKTMMSESTEYLFIFNLLVIKTDYQLFLLMHDKQKVCHASLKLEYIKHFNFELSVESHLESSYCDVVTKYSYCFMVNVFISLNENKTELENKISEVLKWKNEIMTINTVTEEGKEELITNPFDQPVCDEVLKVVNEVFPERVIQDKKYPFAVIENNVFIKTEKSIWFCLYESGTTINPKLLEAPDIHIGIPTDIFSHCIDVELMDEHICYARSRILLLKSGNDYIDQITTINSWGKKVIGGLLDDHEAEIGCKEISSKLKISNKYEGKYIELGEVDILVKRDEIHFCSYFTFPPSILTFMITEIKHIGFFKLFDKELIMIEFNDPTKGYHSITCNIPEGHEEFNLELLHELNGSNKIDIPPNVYAPLLDW